MDETTFWLLLSAKLSGEATPEELSELEAIIKQHPELSWKVQLLSQMWAPKPEETDSGDFFNKHLQRLSNLPDAEMSTLIGKAREMDLFEESDGKKRRYSWLLPFSGIAAAVAIGIFFFLNNTSAPENKAKQPAAKNTVTTRKGSKSNIQLPDGTVVWLNADSKLTYDENFRDDLREAVLEGEAFFDVAKDEQKPFIIHTKTIDIKVLGTAFNVKAYETEPNTETSLIRGSVEITLHNSPEKKIILKPNEKLRVNNKSLEYSTGLNEVKAKSRPDDVDIVVGKIHFQKKDSSALETLWIKNKLAFDAETLEEVMRKIERWYNVKVLMDVDESARATQYSAIFENESLAQVMEALKITGNFSYTINRDTITVK
ncbi:MAG: FecR family protein [Chitinophagaceae bacterium]|nr:FecR family protein [Chitinophagaceae bacterium]